MTGRDHDVSPETLVLRRKRRVQQSRDRIYSEGVEGTLSIEAKRDLAKSAMSYWDVLRDYRDTDAIADREFPDVEPLRSRIGQTTDVVTDAEGLGRGTTTESVPAIAELDGEYLIDVTQQLDDIATALGFIAETNDPGYSEGFQ